METLREIRRRIRSVQHLAQMTRAMEAVSASKVQKAQAAVLATRPYAYRAWEVIVNLSSGRGIPLHPLLTLREPVRSVLIVVFTSDRGLCGAYNHNVVRTATDYAHRLEVPVRYVAVGKRGRNILWRLRAPLIAQFSGLPAVPRLTDITPIARLAMDEFLAGRSDEVLLVYTDFIHLLRQRPVVKRLLPLHPTRLDEQVVSEYVVDLQPARVADYIYEPSPEALLDVVLPRFTELQVYQAALEAAASEHAARRAAMRNATDNAEELLRDLTILRNKARQHAITRELLDIAGGAEALGQRREAAG
ncbi:MAG: ATP synthase F1 subunit gamma [Anaerolineae bacterium]|nr:ATP synthase F1 subunit gamma [Anaerolineae bacterium]MDW8069298.1 ATP synthase F1 subunit gamma [Anaerolineae bacterium]